MFETPTILLHHLYVGCYLWGNDSFYASCFVCVCAFIQLKMSKRERERKKHATESCFGKSYHFFNHVTQIPVRVYFLLLNFKERPTYILLSLALLVVKLLFGPTFLERLEISLFLFLLLLLHEMISFQFYLELKKRRINE